MGEGKSCFVIMPITTPPEAIAGYGGDAQHFEHVLDHLVGPAVEAEGFTLIRPLVDNSEVIQGEIIRHLAHADLVLCDITGWNANVFFELGIRVSLDLPVAMIRDDRTDAIPFDNNMVSCHTYGAGLELWTIEDEIERLRRHIRTAAEQKRNAMWKYFGIATVASLADSSDPVEAKLDLLLSEMQKRSTSFAASSPTQRASADEALNGKGKVRVVKTPRDPAREAREDRVAARIRCDLSHLNLLLGISAEEREDGRYEIALGINSPAEEDREKLCAALNEILESDNTVQQARLFV